MSPINQIDNKEDQQLTSAESSKTEQNPQPRRNQKKARRFHSQGRRHHFKLNLVPLCTPELEITHFSDKSWVLAQWKGPPILSRPKLLKSMARPARFELQ
jgi:hypothetical protein